MSKRNLAPWKNDEKKKACYHTIMRVVDRRFVFGDVEREAFRKYMRMYQKFAGIHVMAFCVMSNHVHLLLEVPPKRKITDKSLLRRLGSLYSQGFVAGVEKELMVARANQDEAMAAEIHERFTRRMFDLSEFMKGLFIRFTRWFNRTHNRKGTLWEERFKSVIVESGTAARVMAAYIDLNPVRAGMVENAEDYRWSSYGEAIGGGKRGNGKKAREGLMRAIFSDREAGESKGDWEEAHREYRMLMDLALDRKPGKVALNAKVGSEKMSENKGEMPGFAKMLRSRVRYFTDGAVIGSRSFVNEVFAASRERFGEKRKDGARKMKGSASAAAGKLWSLRDLRSEEIIQSPI